MALNFPSSPTLNQVYTAEGVTFVWNGSLWVVLNPFPWATNAEALAGVNTDRPMTPAATKAALDAIPAGAAQVFGVPTSVGRAQNTNYQNTLGRPMMVSMRFTQRDTEATMDARVGPSNVNPPTILLARQAARRGGNGSLVFVVPTGWWYRAVGSAILNPPTITAWWEWR